MLTHRVPVAESLEGRRLFAVTVPVVAQTNLVSDGAVPAQRTDANLVNSWGLVIVQGEAWVSNADRGVATVFDTTGAPLPPTAVNIPAPGGATGHGVPTGVAFNGGKGFAVTGNGRSAPAIYLFATEDGTIAGWSPSVDATNAVLAVDRSAAGAVYKGLATAGKGKGARLYAANFHAGAIDVFDANFQPVSTPGAFADPNLPAGFAPFNVQNLGGKLYVTYAKQDATAEGDVPGAGNGFVDVFDTKGRLVRRLASGGALNSPWGVAKVARKRFGGDVLVGNFGDGAINVFSSKGAALGKLNGTSGQPLAINGLWGLFAGTDKKSLFFTAGPNDEADGLFGVLTAQSLSLSGSGSGGTGGTGGSGGTGGGGTPYPYPSP